MLAGGSTPDTSGRVSLAGPKSRAHTGVMPTARRTPTMLGLSALLCAWALASAAHADEIRLKDGKKLHGVIVAYEDNMFKVKTDFGYVLVEKDKIASIIPDTPAQTAPAKTEQAAKPGAGEPKPPAETEAASAKKEKAAAIAANANARPEIPVSTKTVTDASAPAIK